MQARQEFEGMLGVQSYELPKPHALYNETVMQTLKSINDLLQVLTENHMAYVMGVSSTDASRNDLCLMTNVDRSDANMMMADMLRGSIEAHARQLESA